MSTALNLEIIRKTWLQPAAAASRLLDAQDRLLEFLATVTRGKLSIPFLRKAFKALLGIAVAYRANKLLSRLYLNNFTRDRTWNWREEIVLITGGSSGIGEIMVRKLAKRSIKVVVLDLQPPRTPFPASVWFFQADVTSSADIGEAARKIRQQLGEPTVLINNAGVGTLKPMLEESEEEIRRTFNVNNISLFLMTREFLPHMIKRNHGHVVTIASLASFITLPSLVDYSATKAAALAFHEGLTQELKHIHGANRVRTSVIHPIWIRTPLINDLWSRKNFKDQVLEGEDVAEAVVDQVLRCESGQVILPPGHTWVSGWRGYPGWFQNMMSDYRSPTLL